MYREAQGTTGRMPLQPGPHGIRGTQVAQTHSCLSQLIGIIIPLQVIRHHRTA